MRLAGRLRTSGEHGSSAVEFALIVPVFVALVFGAVTGGLVLVDKITASDIARDASRFAMTVPETSPGAGPDLMVIYNATRSSADSRLGTDPAHPVTVCVSYIGTSARRVIDGLAGSGNCFDDSLPSGAKRVQVSVTRESTWSLLVFDTWEVPVTGSSVARYEAPPP